MNKVPKALAVSVAIACLVVIWSEWTRNPSPLPDAQWQQMADYLKKHAIKDTIVLNNGGSTEGLKTLQSGGLKVRLALPEPRGRIRRLWVVGRHPYRAQGHDKLGPNELPKESVPKGFYLDHFARSAGSILWDAGDELFGAQISAANKPCTQPHSGGKRCAHLPNWMHVSPTQLTRSNTTYDCLWAHPPSGNRPLTIRYSQIPKGKLTFEHGLSDTAARSNNRQPVRVKLKWASGEAALSVGNNDGWKRSKHQVEGFLELQISAAQDGQRHHCFKAVIR